MEPIHMAGPSVSPEDVEIVLGAVRNGWYAPDAYTYVEAFEEQFAERHGRRFALMTPNCTTAIHLALEGLGVGEGDEVIAPECTWIGSTAGIHHARADTVLVDIDASNWCLTADTARKGLSSRTKAIVAVDLYGNMPDWEELSSLSHETGIPIIEDAAEALGSKYQGVPAGKWGVASVFSFHRTKTLTTGEGGMLLTDDESLFERCKVLRDHGRQPGSYFNEEIAFKYMPSNLQAALGFAQLRRMDELVQIKRSIFERYRENLGRTPLISMNPDGGAVLNGVWATAVVFQEGTGLTTDYLLERLPPRGVPLRPFFYPLSSLPAYSANDSGGPTENPVAYSVSSRGVHLPCAMNMTTDQIDFISEEILAVISDVI